MLKTLKLKNSIIRILIFALILTLTTAVINVDASSINETADIEKGDIESIDTAPTGDSIKSPVVSDDGIEEPIEENLEEDVIEEDNSTNKAIEDTMTNSATIQNETNSIVSSKAITPTATILSDSAIVVNTFSELKSYMEDGNNGYTEFYLGADITQTSGIVVNRAKQTVLISGKNPTTGAIHTYTEFNSAAIGYTIQVSGNTNITVQDLIIDGHNYYGTVSATDATGNSGVYIKYDRVNYDGPQLCYAPYSTLHIKDSSIVIPEAQKPGSANQEVSESSKVVLDGDTNIQKLSGTGFSTFWIHNRLGDPALRVLEGANIQIKSVSYIFYCVNGNVSISIDNSASLDCDVAGGMTYIGQYLGYVNIENDATFRYIHDGTYGNPRTLILRGNLTVGNNATFDVRRTQRSYSGVALSRILLSMESSTSTVNFNNPKRVIMVNGITTNPEGLIRFSAGGTLNIYTDAMNLWNTVPTGFSSNIMWNDPLDSWLENDLPLRAWNQEGFQPIQLTATYSSSSPVASPSISISGGYEPATDNNEASITSANFLGTGSRMFTLGKTYLNYNYVYDNSNKITGESQKGSYVSVDYENSNGQQSASMITNTGTFSFVSNADLIKDSIISGTNQINFLRGYNKTIVREDTGVLRFYEVPSTLNFYSDFVPTSESIIKREDDNWSIKVEDTRGSNNTWQIHASIDDALSTSHNNTTFTLPDALIYKSGGSTDILSNTPLLIHSGLTDSEAVNGITTIDWNSNEGPLVSVDENDDLISNTEYTTTITWTLIDGP